MLNDVVVAAVDVGKLANVGWWRISDGGDGGGTDLDELVALLVNDLDSGRRVAIGIEAPMFIPNPPTTAGLGRQRLGEAGRPWCAGAGTIAMAFGVQQASYLLHRVAENIHCAVRAGFDPGQFSTGSLDLLVWEAFVSGGSKDRTAHDAHVSDARAAAQEFHHRLLDGGVHTDIDDTLVQNLVAGSLISSGLSDQVALLRTPCVVVKPPNLQSAMPTGESPLVQSPSSRPTVRQGGKLYPCPIPECEHVFRDSRGGWDPHVASMRKHKNWQPEIIDGELRKALFRQEFEEWFLVDGFSAGTGANE